MTNIKDSRGRLLLPVDATALLERMLANHGGLDWCQLGCLENAQIPELSRRKLVTSDTVCITVTRLGEVVADAMASLGQWRAAGKEENGISRSLQAMLECVLDGGK